jgi:hypothetical protein
LTKLGTYLVLKRIWNPIDFQGQRSRSLGQIYRRGDTPRFALLLFTVFPLACGVLLLVALVVVLEGLDFEESFLLSVATQGSYGSWDPGKVMDFYFVK